MVRGWGWGCQQASRHMAGHAARHTQARHWWFLARCCGTELAVGGLHLLLFHAPCINTVFLGSRRAAQRNFMLVVRMFRFSNQKVCTFWCDLYRA